MNKINFAFLILHYNTIEDTIASIDSIKKYCSDNYQIVVVDNGSPNKTGEQLVDLYKDDNKVDILLTGNNLGFANGNNVGFEFICNNYNVDFIVMMNNDTCILNESFCRIVKNEYSNSQFAVMGPKIQLLDGTINPVQEKLPTKKELIKRKRRMIIQYITSLLYIYSLYEFLKKIYYKITKKKTPSYYNKDSVNNRAENVILHGSFLIFSKEYFSKFKGIDSRTFMYMEEKLLYVRLMKNKLKTVYNPDLVIFHKEDSATNSVLKSNRKKRLFLYKNAIHSMSIIISEL